MEKNLVLILLAVIAFSINSNPAEAADLVIEVENLELFNAEVHDLESASGKVVAFDVESAEAKGEVELDRGVYMVYLNMFAPDPEQDAVYIAVGETQERTYPSIHETLTESGSFSLNILGKKKYPISITFGEPGLLLDKLVIRLVSDQAVTEPAEDVPSPVDTMPVKPTNAEPGPTDGRPQVIATSDGEIDDECSMVRFLLYANEWDIEGIITSSSQYHWHGHRWPGDDWVQPYLDAYAKVYPNLVKHDSRYPTPEYLQARTLLGNVETEGEMDAITPGSQLIVRVLLDESDDRPVWLQAWGGPNTIARALKTIEEEHPEKMAYVANKIRFFFIWEQDSTYQAYIRPHWGKYNIQTIVSDQFEAIAYRWDRIIPKEKRAFFSGAWMKQNILQGHGPLCALYRAHEDGRFRSEGDSPAFLHTIVTGLRNLESPDWGGWGGRYVKVRENTWLDPVLESGYQYPEGRWYSSSAWGRKRVREEIPNDQAITAYLKPIWRWADALQNDFAARADWCAKPYDQANHPPVVKLAHALDLKVRPRDRVSLSAKGTTDPDGDALTYRWWQYQEADTYDGTVEIENACNQDASLTVPNDASEGETIHIICEVTDAGTPPLTRYQRVICNISGVMAFSSIATAADLAKLEAEVGLNDEQKSKVSALLGELIDKRRPIKLDSSLSSEERKTKMKALNEEFLGKGGKINVLMTAEQFAKWEKFQQARRDALYTALEPAYGSQWIEMLGGYPVQVDISGDGLRERGLGSCSSKISWSPPQCGHFNFLPAIA